MYRASLQLQKHLPYGQLGFMDIETSYNKYIIIPTTVQAITSKTSLLSSSRRKDSCWSRSKLVRKIAAGLCIVVIAAAAAATSTSTAGQFVAVQAFVVVTTPIPTTVTRRHRGLLVGTSSKTIMTNNGYDVPSPHDRVDRSHHMLPTPTKLAFSSSGSGSGSCSGSTTPTSKESESPTSVINNTTTTNNNNSNNTSRSSTMSDDNPRSCILQVGVYAGRLCGIANTDEVIFQHGRRTNHRTNETDTGQVGPEVIDCLQGLTRSLWLVSKSLSLHFEQSIQNKLRLNAIKYPVEHCKGKAGKYTEYSHLTGITTTNQSTIKSSPPDNRGDVDNNTDDTTTTTTTVNPVVIDRIHTVQPFEEFVERLPALAHDVDAFATERQWTQYHTPRNLVMALLGEVGELSEILQFHGDPDGCGNDDDDDDDENGTVKTKMILPTNTLDKLSQEIADVTIYMLRLVFVCDMVEPLYDALKRKEVDFNERMNV